VALASFGPIEVRDGAFTANDKKKNEMLHFHLLPETIVILSVLLIVAAVWSAWAAMTPGIGLF
jgi:hypothetical protein